MTWTVRGEAHGSTFNETGFDTAHDAEDYAASIIDGDVCATVEVVKLRTFWVSLDTYVRVEAEDYEDAAALAPAAVVAYLQEDGIAEFVVEEED